MLFRSVGADHAAADGAGRFEVGGVGDFAGDEMGRILCAIGYTPGDFSIDKVCVWLSSAAGEVYVCENAAYHPYSEDEAAKVLAEHDILVKVDMGTGDASAKAWGCDLTYDYVKINGDYRT